MAHISIHRQHKLTPKKAQQAAEKIAVQLKEKFDLDYAWHGQQLDFERPGVSGAMLLEKNSVKLEVQLSFLLLPLRGRIEEEIHRRMDELFGDCKTA